jgi:large subunit ribosomal protein L22
MARPADQQEVRAVAKWVRMSPRKARLVTQHISGRSVPEARTVLAFTQRAAAREVEKVLRSAIANAEANHGLNGDELIVSGAYVDEGPVMKRWRARARGRVARIKKPTCHITIRLKAPPATPALPRSAREAERAAPAQSEAAPAQAEAAPAQAEAAPEPSEAAPEPKRTAKPDETKAAPKTRKEAPKKSQTSSDSS